MISYSIKPEESDFSKKKELLEKILKKSREDKKQCSYATFKEYDKSSNRTSIEYIYSFSSNDSTKKTSN